MPRSPRLRFPALLLPLLATLGACGSDDDPGSTTARDAGAGDAALTDATTADASPLRDASADLDSAPVATGTDAGDAATTGGDAGDDGEAGAKITVTGTVVTVGERISGVTVIIAGQSAVTDASGSFTLRDVSVPYDLSVIVPAPMPTYQPKVTQVVGLHGTSPVISVLANVAPPPNRATVTGTVTGGASAPNSTHTGFVVQARSASGNLFGDDMSPGTATTKDFDLSVTWPSDQPSRGVVIFALQTTPDTGIPTAYGYAGMYADPTPVTNGATSSNNVVPLTATTDSSVSGSIVLPAGYTLGLRGLGIHLADDGELDFDDQSTSSTFDFATPSAPFITGFDVTAYATDAAGEQSDAILAVVPGTTGNTVDPLHAPGEDQPGTEADRRRCDDDLLVGTGGRAALSLRGAGLLGHRRQRRVLPQDHGDIGDDPGSVRVRRWPRASDELLLGRRRDAHGGRRHHGRRSDGGRRDVDRVRHHQLERVHVEVVPP